MKNHFITTLAALSVTTCLCLFTGVIQARGNETAKVYDAWVYAADSTTSATNNGAAEYLAGYPTSNCNTANAIAYIKFDLSSYPDTVDKVNLVVEHMPHTNYCYSNCEADFYFYPVMAPWDEMTITYDNRPALGTDPVYGPIHISFPNDMGQQKYDITDIYRRWKNGSLANYGLAIYSPTVGCNNAAVGFYVYSSENSTHQGPTLEVIAANDNNNNDNNNDNTGTDSGSESGGSSTTGQTTSTFTIHVDADTVDILLPTPTFSDTYRPMERSYQPFGNDAGLDMESSSVYAGVGSVRVDRIFIDGAPRWYDLTIDTRIAGLPLGVVDWGQGSTSQSLPQWNYTGNNVSFELATADIFGPPARIRYFDVGISDRLYDVDFDYNPSAGAFTIGATREKGYLHYFPDKENPKIIIGGQDETVTNSSSENYIDFPGVEFQAPMALTGWDGGDGKQAVTVSYATGNQIQTMIARDGMLVGTYSPPPATDAGQTVKLRLTAKSSIGSWFHRPTESEELDACIQKKSTVYAGFAATNKLSQQLTDLAFTIVGSNALKFSDSTLEKIRTAIADSKDTVMQVMANGHVDADTLGVFVSTTILKNATPEEQQKIIEQVWGNNIPGDVQVLANGAGSAAEGKYRTAAKAIAEGIASHAFPAFTSLVKTEIEAINYLKDTLADGAFQELYKQYKASGGNWEEVATLSALSTNKFADSRIRAILKAQKKLKAETSEANKQYNYNLIDNFLKKKMEDLYANEQAATEYGEKMSGLKDKFTALSMDQKDLIKQRMGDNVTRCDVFEKYIEYVTKAEMDLRNSMQGCSGLPPSKDSLHDQAVFMTKRWLRSENYAERKARYQQDKVSFLQNAGCLEHEGVAGGDSGGNGNGGSSGQHGVWVLYDKIPINGCQFFESKCYTLSCNASEGSYQIAMGFDTCGDCDTCGGDNGSGTYTIPPAVLVPGEKISLSVSSTGDGWASIDACFYSTAEGLTFDDHGSASFSAEWCQQPIASTGNSVGPHGEFTVPVGLNKEGAILIDAGGTLGTFDMSRDYYYLYRWQE